MFTRVSESFDMEMLRNETFTTKICEVDKTTEPQSIEY
jgi:hypothetical protein